MTRLVPYGIKSDREHVCLKSDKADYKTINKSQNNFARVMENICCKKQSDQMVGALHDANKVYCTFSNYLLSLTDFSLGRTF